MKPSITICNENSYSNAEIFSQAGAARLMPESTLNAQTLVRAVVDIVQNPGTSAAMKKAALQLAVRDSALVIATLVEKI
jgi:UDP-N-acetylglucosamine:LPS N-acetylglucosamine transferase